MVSKVNSAFLKALNRYVKRVGQEEVDMIKKTVRWLIYNRKENLWWSNKDGWVDRSSATRFSTYEKGNIPYIPGVKSTWVRW